MLKFKNHAVWGFIVLIVLLAVLNVGCEIPNQKSNSISQIEKNESKKPISYVDLDRDGQEESIFIDKSQIDNHIATLRICDINGKEIWREEAGTPHAGWNSLFLSKVDREYYLLRYNPYMGQGYATYTYSLFTLEGGSEKAFQSNMIEFDIIGAKKLDAHSMFTFAQEVNKLLENSILLLSSEDGKFSFGPSSPERFLEKYSWLNETQNLYNDDDNLETRLNKYSEYAISEYNK